jgi:hypothetical protein
MRRNILLAVIFLVSINIYAQESVDHIELLGKGVAGMEEAVIAIPDWENIDYIIAEAVYACGVAPGDVRFSTNSESITVSPEVIRCGGETQDGLITSVFKTRFENPTPEVAMDIMENRAQFRSFSLFVHRPDGTVNSIPIPKMEHIFGELVHVYKNEKVPELTEVVVPVSDEPRDIQLKFGFTEFIDDDLVAVFTFEAKGEVVATEIKTYFQNGEIDPFTVQDIIFEDVAGEVDKIHMTMFSTNKAEESFIAGQVYFDLPEQKRDIYSASVD